MAAGLLENEKGLIMVIIRDPRADSVLVSLKAWAPEAAEKAGVQGPGAGREQVDIKGSRGSRERSEESMGRESKR